MKTLVRITLAIVVVGSLTVAPAYAGGVIHGTVAMKIENNTTIYADWLRVLLVRDKIPVPTLPDLETINKFKRMEQIRTAHMDFYIAARDKLAQDGFVVAAKMTTPEGVFFFDNVDPGKYYILVTFPAMIKTYKVAWQVPVTLKDDETIAVELNNGNMVLPTYSR